MLKIGFVFLKGGTGKTTLAASAVLYLNALVGPAGFVDASPVPMGALLLGIEPKPGVYAGREEIPVAVVGSPERLGEGYKALEEAKAALAVVDTPPLEKSPRLDVAVVVADPPGLRFAEVFKADAPIVVLAVNKADKVEAKYKALANYVVALPYSPGVEKAYQMLIPPVLAKGARAPALSAWKKAFLKLMSYVEREVKK